MNKTLLLISERPEDQAFAVEVALTAGLSLQTIANAKDGVAIIAQEGAGVIFVDTSTEPLYQAFEGAIQETIGIFSDKINPNLIHFLSSEELGKAHYLVQSPIFGHYVHRNFKEVKETGAHYGRLVKATLMDRAFGLANLLKPNTKIQVVKLQNSNQKPNVVDAVKNFLIAAKFQTRMGTVVANAVDELLMNAIFMAPVDELGKPIHAMASRNMAIPLVGQAIVEMHIGFDGEYVGITIVDNYGSLDKVRLLKQMSKIYAQEEYKVKTSMAGAGVGLSTVFNAGASFFFVSESRNKTEATVFFKKTDNFREFKDQFQFVSTQFYF